MKKVLFVATVVKKHINVFHLPYLEWFKQNGYETHVCARNDFDEKDKCHIPFCDKYYDLPFERSPFSSKNILVFGKLNRIIKSENYDIIHCHTPMGGVLTRLSTGMTKEINSKVIYTAHGFHFYKGAPILNWLLYYPIEKLLARYTDVLITITKEDYTLAQKLKPKKVEYIPGVGIDTKKYSQLSTDFIKKRAEIGVPVDAFLILSVGELNKNKNHETIIKALAKIKDPTIYFVICGEGPLEYYLRDIVDRLGVKKQVKFLGYRTDIAEILHVSNVFGFSSFREGLSLALMEAMAAGLPVICSKIRGNTDLIEQNHGGYLLEADNVTDFTKSIMNLKSDVELRRLMGKRNVEKAKKYDQTLIIEQMKKIYTTNLSK